MPIRNYSVLKGAPTGAGQVSGSNPHYRFALQIDGGSTDQVDVNVQSSDGSEIRYLIVSNFTPPDPADLESLPLGQTPLNENSFPNVRLDYVLQKNADGSPLVDPSQFQNLDIGDNGLNDAVAALLNQALQDPNGLIYAFGSFFADSGGQDGIHDIHLNQGNPPGSFEKDNGSWQDGALFIQLPDQASTWTALFLAFQTQNF